MKLNRDEYKSRLEERPSIAVQPIREGKTFFLLVTNNGESATFAAQLKLESDDINVRSLTNLSFYHGLWDTPYGRKAEILKGHSAKIQIALIHSESVVLGETLYINSCQANGDPDSVGAETRYFGAKMTNTETGASVPLLHNRRYDLLVIVSSVPALREGVFRERYSLGYEGLSQDS